MTAPVAFEKWQALGNDYLIVEERHLPFSLTETRVRRICDPHTGVGSDGVLLLSQPDEPGFVARLRIFNPDGSEAELSGNGAREAILYLRRSGWTDRDRFSIQTAAGEIRPTITGPATCTVDMGRARTASDAFPSGGAEGTGTLEAGGRRWEFRHVSVGNPQCTIHHPDREDLERLDLARIGPQIEHHPLFPQRTNVSWYCAIAPDAIRARIFERGAGETMSSGTGASGAAVAHVLRGGDSPVTVHLDGGERRGRGGGPAPEPERLGRSRVPGRAGRGLRRGAERNVKASRRLDRIPPYLFAELERKIAAQRAAGVDVISLGIGDPDRPTPALIVDAMQEAVTEPETHRYPSNRGRQDFREAVADFYARRFDVTLDPATEVMPAIGAKECIFNLNLAFLDPGTAALASDPGYPVYTGGPVLAGGDAVLMPLLRERGFMPDLGAITAEDRDRSRLMFFGYPNNPTGAVVREGFFEEVVDYVRGTDILAVHDNAYSETTYDGYRAPSFLATEGAKDAGVEVFSFSKGYNMTGWRCAAIVGNAEAIDHYWRLKTNIDSGLFEAVQLAGIAALSPDADGDKREMNALYARRRDLVVDALRAIGVAVTPPHGTIYIWAPIPATFATAAEYCEHVLEEAGVAVSPGGAYGPNGEGFFRISLTTPDDRLVEAVERLGRLAVPG